MNAFTGTVDAGTVDRPADGGLIDGGGPDTTYNTVLSGGNPFTVAERPPATRPSPARWTFVLTTPDGTELADLTAARSRKVSIRLTEDSELSFSIDGRHEQAAQIVELATDVIAYRGGEKLLRGRIGNTQDQLDADRHTIPVTAPNYRAVLGRRILYDDDPLTYAQVDQEAIGWSLIAATQARAGGDLGITRGLDQATGILRDRNYEAGKSIGEAVQQLSELSDGFDWDIDPDLVYRVYHPARGADSPMLLDFGGSVSSVSRNVETGGFANAHRVSGAEGDDTNPGPAPEIREAAVFGPEGRWDRQVGYTDISETSTLAAKADWHQAEESVLRAAYTLKLKPGRWNSPADLWVGDYSLVVIRSGRLDIVSAERVYGMDFTLGDSGEEEISVTVGRTDPLTPGRREREVQRRLRQLERR